jgi:holliday junction DNA helicase RuvA
MIGRLRGELLEVTGNMVVVDVGGVGYEVLVPDSVMLQMPQPGEKIDLRIRQVIREDAHTLYGFLEPFQRRLFDLLTDVKGCGPKSGLSLIGQLGEDAVAGAILAGDARVLARASGVGPRLAERIILELKEKIAEESFLKKVEGSAAGKVRTPAQPEDELVDALLALGYRRQEAESAANEARDKGDTVEEQLKIALRGLQR